MGFLNLKNWKLNMQTKSIMFYLNRGYDRIYFIFPILDMMLNFYIAFLIGTSNPDMKSIDCNQGTDYITCGVGR